MPLFSGILLFTDTSNCIQKQHFSTLNSLMHAQFSSIATSPVYAGYTFNVHSLMFSNFLTRLDVVPVLCPCALVVVSLVTICPITCSDPHLPTDLPLHYISVLRVQVQYHIGLYSLEVCMLSLLPLELCTSSPTTCSIQSVLMHAKTTRKILLTKLSYPSK